MNKAVRQDEAARKISDLNRLIERLQESESRFRTLANDAPVPIWVCEAENGCVFVNKACCELFGRTMEELQGFGWTEQLHPADSERYLKDFDKAIQDRSPFRCRARFKNAQGTYRWIDASGTPRFSPSDEFLGFVGTSVDVTEAVQIGFNSQFINRLEADFSQFADPDEIVRCATGQLCEYLRLFRCQFLEIDRAADQAVVAAAWQGRSSNASEVTGTYRVADFITPELREALESGQTLIVSDVTCDSRVRDLASTYQSFGVCALVSVPVFNDNRWVATFSASASQARDWQPDEVQLLRDVSARIWSAVLKARAIRALRENEEHARRTLAEQMLAGIAECDPTGRFTMVNQRFCDISGRTRNELLTLRIVDITHEDDWPRNRELLQRLYKTGESFFFEKRYRRKDGAVIWLHTHVSPVHNHQDEIVGDVGIVIDVSDRKRVELELASAKDRLAADLDIMTRLDKVNAAFVLEGDLTSVLQEVVETAVAITGAATGFIKLVDPASDYPLTEGESIQSTLVRGPSGRIVAILSTHYEASSRPDERRLRLLDLLAAQTGAIVERAQAERELRSAYERAERAVRAKDEFLTVVSHELRSPLTAIVLYSRLLRTSEQDAEKVKRMAGIIERSGDMQLQLIEDLLDSARIISGKLKLDVKPVDLFSVITAAIDVVLPSAQAKGIELVAGLEDFAGQVTGDPDRLQQVLWNLLSNAVKFTPQGGRIEVILTRDDPHVQIVVRDTGKGIELEFLPHVFDRFHQSDMSSTRRTGGLGVGLSLVKHLVELHGGTVHVESAGKNQGATFTVSLPLRAIYMPPAGEDRTVAEPRRRLIEGVQVLVVDDVEDVRHLLAETLEGYGARVESVASGQAAIERLAQQTGDRHFDVLICDIGMPDEDGYSVIRRVRTAPPAQGGEIPAIALTAYSRPHDRMRALQAGFQMHVAKPVDPDELVTVILSLVRRFGVSPESKQPR